MIFERFLVREAFQRVPRGSGSVLTKYQLKRRHLDLIHDRFHDFAAFSCKNHISVWATDTICLCATETAVSVPQIQQSLCNRHNCLCATDTIVHVPQTQQSLRHKHTCVCASPELFSSLNILSSHGITPLASPWPCIAFILVGSVIHAGRGPEDPEYERGSFTE